MEAAQHFGPKRLRLMWEAAFPRSTDGFHGPWAARTHGAESSKSFRTRKLRFLRHVKRLKYVGWDGKRQLKFLATTQRSRK